MITIKIFGKDKIMVQDIHTDTVALKKDLSDYKYTVVKKWVHDSIYTCIGKSSFLIGIFSVR